LDTNGQTRQTDLHNAQFVPDSIYSYYIYKYTEDIESGIYIQEEEDMTETPKYIYNKNILKFMTGK